MRNEQRRQPEGSASGSEAVLISAGVLPQIAGRTLIDELIAEQQRLTAVERFTRRHHAGALPAQARYYRDLVPIRKPEAGEQFAFAVDLDACSGCKGCVSACHALNGLDDDELWRDVGLLHGGNAGTPYQQTITSACHHCVEPACLEGCPVMAYEKEAATGIVRHLDDQCIGCQYCILKCPYDVPKYSARRGIVRKCDMCHSRLAAAEAPACVQACPNEAIAIRLVDTAEISAMSGVGARLVPDAFPSDYTKPTTRYTSARSIPADARAADAHALRLEAAHWPLIFMTVLTQAAAGMFMTVALIAFFASEPSSRASTALSQSGFVVLSAGLAISTLHLGRPLGAWRFFLGLRTSWMSREILAFALFTGAAFGLALGPRLTSWLQPAVNLAFLAPLVALLGIGSVFCSAMIYVDTRRPFWRRSITFPKFFGTTVILGVAAAGCLLGGEQRQVASGVMMLSLATVFTWELWQFFSALRSSNVPAHFSSRTIWMLQRPLLGIRALLIFAALIASACATNGWCAPMLAFFLALAAQFIERYLFFTAVIAPRMPGGVAA